jgi:hypothetical protein
MTQNLPTAQLTPTRHAALLEVAQENVTRQQFPLGGMKPYYLISGTKLRRGAAAYDFLIKEGFARHSAPNTRGTRIVITDKGADYFRF